MRTCPSTKLFIEMNNNMQINRIVRVYSAATFSIKKAVQTAKIQGIARRLGGNLTKH